MNWGARTLTYWGSTPNTLLSVICKETNSDDRRTGNVSRIRKEGLLNLKKDTAYGAGEFLLDSDVKFNEK
jgi:hypothetical protein